MNHPINQLISVKGGTRPAFVYSEARNQADQIKGRVYLKQEGCKEDVCISDAEGDYDLLSAVSDTNTIYAAVGEYREGVRFLRLYAITDQTVRYAKDIAPKGKYTNLSLCLHEGTLYLAAQLESGNFSDILVYHICPENGQICRTISATKGERAYRPVMASAGASLFLAYESFYGGRYHMMVRALDHNGRHFSEGVEAGCDMVNDNAPFLCSDGENAYLCWENSSPLFPGDTWVPPDNQPLILMPSYGHGWRVRSKIMMRRLSVCDGALRVDIPDACKSRDDPLAVQATEDAGEASCFMLDGQLFILFVENAGKGHYHVVVAGWDQNRFVRLEHPVILLCDRKPPAFFLDGKDLVVYSQQDDYRCTQYRIPLASKAGQTPAFRPDKAIKLSTLRSTPAYCLPEREKTVIGGQEYSLFWGDLHMHSNISRCSRHPAFHCTNVEEKHRFSRDAGGLDFCLLTDHETMNDIEWARTVKSADFSNEDHAFTSFVGYEWTSSQLKNFHNYGHYNVLYRNKGDIRRIHDGSFDNLEKLWSALEPGMAMTIPHHPSESMHPLDWNYFNKDMVRLVEIYQVRGSDEYDGCDFDPRNFGRSITPHNSVQDGLRKGYRFGFTSGGEHEGVGLTGVYAKELTRDGIFDALYHRRTYGTTSIRLYATFFVDEWFMGSEIPTPRDEVTLSGTIHGSDDVVSVVAVSNLGETDLTANYCAQTGEYRAQYKTEGIDWVYLRIKQADGNMAWLSPVFFGTD